MSDLARLILGVARLAGARRALLLGPDRGLRAELEPALACEPLAGEPEAAGEAVLVAGALDEAAEAETALASLRALLGRAPAAVVAARERELAGAGRWSAGELHDALEGAGLGVLATMLTDGAGTLGDRAAVACVLAGARADRLEGALAAGPLGLAFDPAAEAESPPARPPRVCIVSYEFVGPTRTGGIGTAYTSLAEALAAAGHDVSVLFTGWEESGQRPLSYWAEHYRKRGISLFGLPASPRARSGNDQADRSYAALHWLREQERRAGPFDVVHFPETVGHGYYACLAKRQGLALERTTLVIGAHSSTAWVLETNGLLCQGRQDFADQYIERMSVANADVLVSPSAYMLEWMRANGWQLPERAFVQQYARSGATAAGAEPPAAAPPTAAPPAAAETTEVVFFGRLETRKGLKVFCDALDLLAERSPPPLAVTFLGRQAHLEGVPAGEYVRSRAEEWPWEAKVVDSLGQPEAIAYLRGPGRRIAVMPSLADNSPNTVYEALAIGIPFIASRIGGTAELIDPRDLARCSFDPREPRSPQDRRRGPAALADRLREMLAARELEPPRAAVDAVRNRAAHVAWHERIAAASQAEPARPPEGAAEPPELVLQLADGLVAEPGAAERLGRIAARTGAEILAPAVRVVEREGEVERVAVGGPPLAGLLIRCLGDLAFAIRPETLAELGGMDAGAEASIRAHELLCRAVIAGKRIEAVPEPMAGPLDERRAGPIDVAEAWRVRPEILRLYERAPEELLRQLPRLAQQSWAVAVRSERELLELYLHRFGRATRLVRWASGRLRAARARAPGSSRRRR